MLQGIVRDNGIPLSLSGTTLALKLRIDAVIGVPGTVKSVVPTADPDQVTNTGKYTFQCGATEFDAKGTAYLQMHVTSGGATHKSLIVDRQVQESLA